MEEASARYSSHTPPPVTPFVVILVHKWFFYFNPICSGPFHPIPKEFTSLRCLEPAQIDFTLISQRTNHTLRSNISDQNTISVHSCLAEKYKMAAPQWEKNVFNTFLHKLLNISSWIVQNGSKTLDQSHSNRKRISETLDTLSSWCLVNPTLVHTDMPV